MGKPRVVLMDEDLGYITAFETKFLEELGTAIDLELITDRGYAREFLSMPHDIEVLIVSEGFYEDELQRQNAAHTFVLSEREDTGGTARLDVERLFKYTSLNLLFNRVMSSSPLLRPQVPGAMDTRVFLFYSPVGGSGKTTCAIATAALLQETYKRVLFVQAEYVQTFGFFLDDAKMAPLSMADEMGRACGHEFDTMEPFIVSDCFDYLPPLKQGILAFGIGFDYFASFVASARDSGHYDYIIVDTDSVFNDEKSALFSLADKIVVPVTQTASSRYKTERFLDGLDAASSEKTLLICNKYDNRADNAFEDPGPGASVVLDGYVPREDACEGAAASALARLEAFGHLINLVS